MSVADVDSRFMNVKSDQVPLSEALNSWAGLGELVLHTNKIMNIFCFWSVHIYIYIYVTIIIICNLNILRFYFLVI